MGKKVAEQTFDFIAATANKLKLANVNITFHGGEPLLAPKSLWAFMLEDLSKQIPTEYIRWSIQSNLWNLDDWFCKIFEKHKVSIGTSLDGPEVICDKNRGYGYFKKTMNGIQIAKKYGLDVGVISTLTSQSSNKWKEIIKFFSNQNIRLNLHPAIPPLGEKPTKHSLSPFRYTKVLKAMLPYYLKLRNYISISSIDIYCKALTTGISEVCTFQDCLGKYMAIDPNGYIYSCQRFCGKQEFALGNVLDNPSIEELLLSDVGKRLMQREKDVAIKCGNCEEYTLCKGGCTYNALNANSVVDPYCETYRAMFKVVNKRLLKEMTHRDNINAFKKQPYKYSNHPLLREGAVVSLGKKIHPTTKAANARKILSIYELGIVNSPIKAAKNLVQKKICGDINLTENILACMFRNIQETKKTLNNIYIHVTSKCNLNCSHCYAEASKFGKDITVSTIHKVVDNASQANFKKITITGGEPLLYTDLTELLHLCAALKKKGRSIVLRTNFTGNISTYLLKSIADSFTHVSVSLDGNKKVHEYIRGSGTFDSVVSNIRKYKETVQDNIKSAELSITCTLNKDFIEADLCNQLYQLGEELGVNKIRFRPVLPIGRAKLSQNSTYQIGRNTCSYIEDNSLDVNREPISSCGFGQNLYIKTDGDVFPCYACDSEFMKLGNAHTTTVAEILESTKYQKFSAYSVDAIEKCRECEVRYLCGGMCKVWQDDDKKHDLYSPPHNCDHKKKRAYELIKCAKDFLEIK